MPLSETNKPQSQSIEDLIAQLDSPTVMSRTALGATEERKCLKGKRPVTNFVRHSSNGANSVPLLQKNIITSKKYTKNLKSLNNRGLPKKNGAGGKHTWGAPGCELADYYIDSKDPNYDSEEAPGATIVQSRLPKEIDPDDLDHDIKPVILEFFQNGDTIEVIEQLKAFKLSRTKPQLVAYLVQMALENNNTSKELMSRLLRDLTYEIVSEADFCRGFDLLLNNLKEITLDNPDAAEKSGTFIARAVADKVIGRRYIDRFFEPQIGEENMPDLSDGLVLKSVDSARLLVTMNNHLNQLSHIWGNKGGFLAVTELEDKIKAIIQELYDSRDVDEAVRCLKELNVPHFHHELVFEAIDFALQKANDSAMDLMVDFFEKLCQTVVVTYDQFKMGLVRVVDIIQDICLDVPNAMVMLEKMMNKCDSRGFINESILDVMPNRSRKRFVSEGDGGKIKEDVY